MTTISHGNGNAATADAGWYRDPAGTDQVRWWDGAGWTDHLAANPPVAFPGGARSRTRPQIGPTAPVYNAFIWLIVLMPVPSAIFAAFWHPVLVFDYVGSQNTPVLNPLSLLSPWYLIGVGLGWTVNILTIIFAALDRRKLERDGVWWPFHWAWTFLAAPIYIIGRSVVVHRAAPGRGLAPIWVYLAVFALLAVSIVFAETNYFQAYNSALLTSQA